MTLIDDLSEPTTESELERRRFLATMGLGALTTATIGTVITAVRYLSPGVLYEASAKFKAGPVENIAVGSVISFPQKKVYLVRTAEGLFALSSVCTHLGCMTHWEAQHNRVFCPCHGSQFDEKGAVTGGPAPKPLPRLKVSIEKGIVVVDTKSLAAPDELVTV
jgi:cytochrome b6-f complex iron-sulfur subunit